tara:strand:+ start:55 stop:252 length:198 start_codon:yes stop_codon:yes gene_type:complete
MTELFVLVITMWGNDGSQWLYIGNQIVLQQPMSQEACEYMANMWESFYDNEYYKMVIKCHLAGDI